MNKKDKNLKSQVLEGRKKEKQVRKKKNKQKQLERAKMKVESR